MDTLLWCLKLLSDPSSSHGFVVNLHQHWFSLRPIYGAWWNLNSMLSQPTRVGDVYLSAYLGTLRMEGYTIFEVVGGCQYFKYTTLNTYEKSVSIKQVLY